MRIKKIINNNILCAVDDKGNELIVTGRGIGFQRHRGETIDTALIERTYRMEEKTGQRKLRELVEKIPIEHLSLTEGLIKHITSQIPQKLNESLLITMADHISFAILRKAQGVEFSNPLKGPIMCYYPTEYHLGQYCLRVIREQLGVTLHEDEAAFIALHIVNAELNTNMSEMYQITQLIEGTISVVEYFYQNQFDRESLDFNRFVVHLRYFAQRLFQNQIMEDSQGERDEVFRQLIMKNCKEHYKCAQCIADYIKNTYQKDLSDEELTYLTIHLKRINLGSDQ
ncbi:MAG: PRD domain-containing protein [Oscillospiraceae bacterium]|nr:PRD domain-containing protein [Oscillospiraceae bacterium]MBQ7002260.1 PRD domain-containing protein [Oscillospiraceae bacterium]